MAVFYFFYFFLFFLVRSVRYVNVHSGQVTFSRVMETYGHVYEYWIIVTKFFIKQSIYHYDLQGDQLNMAMIYIGLYVYIKLFSKESI